MRRRAFLGVAGAATTAVIGALPHYHRQATLPVEVAVTDWTAVTIDGQRLVDAITLRLTHNGADPVDPVFLTWGQGRQSQLSWPVAEPTDPGLEPGAKQEYRIRARESEDAADIRLVVGQPAAVRIYDRGTERRAAVRFVPEAKGAP